LTDNFVAPICTDNMLIMVYIGGNTNGQH